MSVAADTEPGVAKRRRLGGHLRSVLSALAVVVVVSTGLVGFAAQQRLKQEPINEFIRDEVARLDHQNKDIATFRSEIEALVVERQVEHDWLAQRQWPARLLRLLAECRSAGVQFEQALDAPHGIVLVGRAPSYDEVAAVAATLGRSPMVLRVDVRWIDRDERGFGLRFALEADVDKRWRPLERPRPAAPRVGPAVGDPK